MKIVIGLLKLILKIVAAPVVVVLTVAIWMCVGIVYICGLVLEYSGRREQAVRVVRATVPFGGSHPFRRSEPPI